MTNVISILLTAGVALSGLIVAAGLLLLIVTGNTGYHGAIAPTQLLDPKVSSYYPRSIPNILMGVLALKPFALIELGLLTLIATPVLRVVASIVLFLLENDKLYVLITSAVLVVLVVSIFWIR